MKKSMMYWLGSLAVAALLMGTAGTAEATSFSAGSGEQSRSQLGDLLGKKFASSSKTSFFDDKYDFDEKLQDPKEAIASLVKKITIVKKHFAGTEYRKKNPVPAIPEPSAALIFAAGLAVAGWRRRS